jgi:transcription elongation GreA/GreB family factor
MGKNLLGKKKGDQLTITNDKGSRTFKILKIE